MVKPIIDYGNIIWESCGKVADERSKDDETIRTSNFEYNRPATGFNCDTVSYYRMAAN